MSWGWLETWIAEAPMPVIASVVVIAMGASVWIGSAIRRRREQAKKAEGHEDAGGQEGYVVSAVLGLLALLMGFTFSLAVDRFETRRSLVLEEANAIGTTYLRAQLLPEPHRARVSDLLVRYTDNRLALAKAPDRAARVPLLARNDALLTDLWTATVAAFPSIRGFDFSSSFIDTMNALIDLDSARKAARQAHVPAEVFGVLIVYLCMTAAVLGYVLHGGRGRAAAGFLLILLAISLLLIIDIDRPVGGGISEGQRPMESLQQTLRTWPPQVFDRWNAPAPAQPPAR